MHQSDTTVEGRSEEAAQVVNDSAAKRDNAGVLGDAFGQNLIAGRCKHIQRLVTFGTRVSTFVNGVGRNDDLEGLNTSIAEAVQAFLTIKIVNCKSKRTDCVRKVKCYRKCGQIERV